MRNRKPHLDDAFWLRISFIFFFLSGFCSLVYQIVWVRMAFMNFGIITPVLSVVVSIFMLGLGLGSWLSGKLAVWWMERRHWPVLGLYALTEALVGLTAWQIPHFFNQGSRLLLSLGAMNSPAYLFVSAVLLALTILPACTCMGATIPIMMCHIALVGESAAGFSFLYLANVLGALCGTVLTAAALIELLGFQSTEYVAVVFNFLIAGTAGALVFYLPPKLSGRSAQISPEPAGSFPSQRLHPLLILFSTGLVSMGCEVLWTRAFTPVLGTTIYAFAVVLAAFLLGTGLGSFIYRRLRRPSSRRSAISIETLLIGVALTVYLPLLWNDPRIKETWVSVVFSLLPFCGLLGYMTPRLVDEYAQGNSQAAGWAYAVNIAGCVIGPLLASYVVLPNVGVRTGTIGLSLLFFLLIAINYRRYAPGKLATALTAGGLLVFAALFVVQSCEEVPPRSTPPRVIRRDYAATVISYGTGMNRYLAVNGIGITSLTPLTKMMAHLPVMAYQGHPKSALVICFGMGTTYRSLLTWGLRTTAVELVPSVRDAFSYYHEDAASVMQNPLGTVVIDDGRRFLKRSANRYDIITLDPPPPVEAAGSGLLYSKEFYELLQQHLNPGGIVQQWWPAGELNILLAVAKTLHESFPYIRVFKGVTGVGFHFLASMSPIQLQTPDAFIQEMPQKARQDILEWYPGVPVKTVVISLIAHEIPIMTLLPDPSQPMITDDAPYNEYFFLRRHLEELRSGRLLYVK